MCLLGRHNDVENDVLYHFTGTNWEGLDEDGLRKCGKLNGHSSGNLCIYYSTCFGLFDFHEKLFVIVIMI